MTVVIVVVFAVGMTMILLLTIIGADHSNLLY